MNRLRWWWRDIKRLRRLFFPERSVRRLIYVVGPFWLWRHRARREFKVSLYKRIPGWYCLDIGLPHIMAGIEADGGIHRSRRRQDIVRDHRLEEKGWRILRIDEQDMIDHPWKVRKRVRRFVKACINA